jgi:hypothetical protein
MKIVIRLKGGKGSGFKGHAGRPGIGVGGSGGGGNVSSVLDAKIPTNRNNLRMWHEDMDWDKPLKTYREIVQLSIKDNDIRFVSKNVAIDPLRPLGDSKNIYEIQYVARNGWKKLIEVPQEVYELYQSLKH